MRTCRPKDRRAAKYDLLHTVRVHTGRDDDSFNCMGMTEVSACWSGFEKSMHL